VLAVALQKPTLRLEVEEGRGERVGVREGV
jgi:hypothetical protein